MKPKHPARYFKTALLLGLLTLAGCPLIGAGYVPDGQWRGTITDAPGTISMVVQDGFIRQIVIEGLELESPDEPGVVTSYPIYIHYGFIDGLFPGVEGLPILPTGAFVDHALTDEGSETITGQINTNLDASGTVAIVLFAYNAPDEVYEFTWTADYVEESTE